MQRKEAEEEGQEENTLAGHTPQDLPTLEEGEEKETRYYAEDVAKVRAAFDRFDLEGSGSMEIRHIPSFLRELGHDPTPEDVQEIVDEFDVDRNGTVDFVEILTVRPLRRCNLRAEHFAAPAWSSADAWRAAFRDAGFLGANGGHVNRESFRLIVAEMGFESWTDEELSEVIHSCGTDGQIDIEQFITFISDSDAEVDRSGARVLSTSAGAENLSPTWVRNRITYRRLSTSYDPQILFDFNKTHGTSPHNFIPDESVKAHFAKIFTGETIVTSFPIQTSKRTGNHMSLVT